MTERETGTDPVHWVIRPGDSVCSIAAASGHLPQTLWDDPANADLKAVRIDPELLVPGDRVSIPPIRPKTVACATGSSHVFRVAGRKATVTIFVEDEAADPFANKQYELVGGDETITGTTDDTGKLECRIDARVHTGTLRVWLDEPGLPNPWVLGVRFGELPPVDQPDGIQRRLTNLGLRFGPIEEIPPATLTAFQKALGVAESGEVDAATLQKLVEIHRV
ncbi:MAG: peptidoglycan-binding domain-containing protein [Thermoanaerobaculia bacterium]